MVSFRVPVETSLFNALQLQPRAVLALGVQAFTRTFAADGISYPALLRDWRSGVVFSRTTVDFEEPLRFFDADELEVTSTLSRVRDDLRWLLDMTVGAVGRPPAARSRIVLYPVEIAEPESLSARPAPLPDALAAKLTAQVVDVNVRGEKLRDIASQLSERAVLLGEHRSAFVVDRTACEVADQWYFPDIPRLTEPAREAIVLSRGIDPLATDALSRPLRRLDIELSRPFYWRQEGEVHTRACRSDGRLVVVHQLRSTSPVTEPNGVVVEYW